MHCGCVSSLALYVPFTVSIMESLPTLFLGKIHCQIGRALDFDQEVWVRNQAGSLCCSLGQETLLCNVTLH